MKQINEDMLFAGYGGQGIMVMGRLLAYTAMNLGYEVAGIPSYGAEVRGGTANAMVKVQTGKRIANPTVSHPTLCAVMNRLSLDRFMPLVKEGGTLFIDSTDIKDIPVSKKIKIYAHPFTATALSLGDKRIANMVAIGAINKVKCLFPTEDIIGNLEFIFPGRKDLIELNAKAIEAGNRLHGETDV